VAQNLGLVTPLLHLRQDPLAPNNRNAGLREKKSPGRKSDEFYPDGRIKATGRRRLRLWQKRWSPHVIAMLGHADESASATGTGSSSGRGTGIQLSFDAPIDQ
jgi:hypothetical protein